MTVSPTATLAAGPVECKLLKVESAGLAAEITARFSTAQQMCHGAGLVGSSRCAAVDGQRRNRAGRRKSRKRRAGRSRQAGWFP